MARFWGCGLLLVLAGGAFADAAPRRPNILFLYSDDQSYKTVSCYPEAIPGAKTPHIDALAKSGVRFRYAYMGSWCMPSRASLLTGHHPHSIETMKMDGDYPGSSYDPNVCRFWPKHFREQGYFTAQIGKWHTGVDAGWGRDWDRQIVWNRPKHPKNAGAYYTTQILAEDGVEREQTGYSTDNYTQYAVDFIEGKKRDTSKPWYLWLCYGAIHGPTTPAARHKGTHKNDAVRIPADIFGPRPGKPSYLDKTQSWVKGPNGQPVAGKSGEAFGDETGKNAKTYTDYIHQVTECVDALDEGIGKVMAALKASGQLENTLVVFTADQGFGMGDHGFRTKLGPYDGTYRSPLIISMPGVIPQGKECPHPVHGVDLVQTFYAFAGLKTPWKMHGRDLSPLLADPTGPGWSYPCFYEHTGQKYGSHVGLTLQQNPDKAVHNNVPWYVALNDGRWKYIRYLTAGETEELYDLKNDPEELTNLVEKPDSKADLLRLRQTIVAELKRTDASFAETLPPSKQMP